MLQLRQHSGCSSVVAIRRYDNWAFGGIPVKNRRALLVYVLSLLVIDCSDLCLRKSFETLTVASRCCSECNTFIDNEADIRERHNNFGRKRPTVGLRGSQYRKGSLTTGSVADGARGGFPPELAGSLRRFFPLRGGELQTGHGGWRGSRHFHLRVAANRCSSAPVRTAIVSGWSAFLANTSFGISKT